MPKLIEIGPNGQVTIGHDEPPQLMPGIRSIGRKEVRMSNRSLEQLNQVDLVLPADGRRPERLRVSIMSAYCGSQERSI